MADEPPRSTLAARLAASDPREKLPPGPGLSAREVAAHQTARIRAALVEIVAERGYQGLKVRELVKIAGVSTRAFYERFASKEDCFLSTYELLTARATRRIILAQADERDWRRRPRLVFEEFARSLAHEPAAAQVVLVDAYAAGPKSLERVLRAERHFEGMLAESFARAPGGVVVPPLVIEGMVAGVSRLARDRLRSRHEAELGSLIDTVTGWALSYVDEAAHKLYELDRRSVWRDTTLAPQPELAAATGERGAWPPTGDRALILAAVAKLAVAEGYARLTAPRIRAVAGVSRRKFDAYFDSVEECYVAAFEQRAAEVLAQAARAQTAAGSWAGGVYRATAAICDRIASDAFLASVCLKSDFEPGSHGARARLRLIDAVAEQLSDGVPRDLRPGPIVADASAGGVWGVFHHHVIREWVKRRRIAATLSYLALAPVTGAPAAVAAIGAEQSA